MKPLRCVGLMSGTSMDAVDAALCRFDAAGQLLEVEAVASLAYPPVLRAQLLALQEAPDTPLSLRAYALLDHAVGAAFAQAAQAVLDAGGATAADVAVIGSHGQTVFHDPAAGSSLQLGDPALIAVRTGVAVVADFRRGDIAAGGQGAPLVPAFHAQCFSAHAPCAVLNIGGIANLTLLGPAGVSGFDTGPGNALMDSWIAARLGARFDADGAWAAGGRVHEPLLAAALDDPWFAAAPPKSTGRDRFNLAWLRTRMPEFETLDAQDVQRTLCELTARSIARQLRAQAPECLRVFVCGGGARNATLMAALAQALPGVRVEPTEVAGLPGEVVEPATFAWLAWRRLQGLSGALTSATGAASAKVLGGLYLP